MNETQKHTRPAKKDEKTIPTCGDWGGPLCSIMAKYEDGTEITFGREVLKQYIQADKVKKMIKDFVDLAEKEFEANLAERMAEAVEKYFEKHLDVSMLNFFSEGTVNGKIFKDFFTHIIAEAGGK